MKPRRIILIRHGECHANNDESKFATEPDYTIELTAKGVEQARQAGRALKELLGDESVYFYISPFWRTRSTFENIVRSFPRSHASMLYDTPKTQSAVNLHNANVVCSNLDQTSSFDIFIKRLRGEPNNLPGFQTFD